LPTTWVSSALIQTESLAGNVQFKKKFLYSFENYSTILH